MRPFSRVQFICQVSLLNYLCRFNDDWTPCAQDYLEGFSKVYALFSQSAAREIAVIGNSTREDTEERGADRHGAAQESSTSVVLRALSGDGFSDGGDHGDSRAANWEKSAYTLEKPSK